MYILSCFILCLCSKILLSSSSAQGSITIYIFPFLVMILSVIILANTQSFTVEPTHSPCLGHSALLLYCVLGSEYITHPLPWTALQLFKLFPESSSPGDGRMGSTENTDAVTTGP